MSASHGKVHGWTKLVNHGPDRDRWNLVVLGDGYLSTELAAYRGHVNAFWAALRTTPPYDGFVNAINVYRIDIASHETGAKLRPTDSRPRTFLDASFNTIWNGKPLERLLSVREDLAVATAHAIVPNAHQILVIANSAKYGGSGGPDVAVCSRDPQSTEIAIHEIGHSSWALADEYDYGRGQDAVGPEPSEANVSRSDHARGKWEDMIPTGTSLPTLASAVGAPAPVGVYEGARYYKRRMYRPYPQCFMNDFKPFCPVCTREISDLLQYYV